VRDRVSSGNKALDRILGGGFGPRSANVLVGEPGTGKTLFVLELLFHLARAGRKSLHFTTLSEPALKLVHDMQQLRFFDQQLVESSIVFADLGAVIRTNGMEATLDEIQARIEREAPDVVVIDSYKAVREVIPDAAVARNFFYDLTVALAARGIVSFFISEYARAEIAAQCELSIADSVLYFGRKNRGRTTVRELEVLKRRGASYLSGMHSFEISSEGLTFYPRVPTLVGAETSSSDDRLASGIPGLDEMLGGGPVRGSTTLLCGGTGTAKSLLALAFLVEGARRGEPGVHLSLEESPAQLRRIGASLGWDIEGLERRSLLELCHASPLELNEDRFLGQAAAAAERLGARRAGFDSLTSLLMAAPSTRWQELAGTVIQQLRRTGVTSFLTIQREHLLADGGLLGAVDNVLQLRLLELDGAIERGLSVHKARGARHSGDLRPLVVGPVGLAVGDGFAPPRGGLTGEEWKRVVAPAHTGRRRTLTG
jgi:circadian clock protein KaiC